MPCSCSEVSSPATLMGLWNSSRMMARSRPYLTSVSTISVMISLRSQRRLAQPKHTALTAGSNVSSLSEWSMWTSLMFWSQSRQMLLLFPELAEEEEVDPLLLCKVDCPSEEEENVVAADEESFDRAELLALCLTMTTALLP